MRSLLIFGFSFGTSLIQDLLHLSNVGIVFILGLVGEGISEKHQVMMRSLIKLGRERLFSQPRLGVGLVLWAIGSERIPVVGVAILIVRHPLLRALFVGLMVRVFLHSFLEGVQVFLEHGRDGYLVHLFGFLIVKIGTKEVSSKQSRSLSSSFALFGS